MVLTRKVKGKPFPAQSFGGHTYARGAGMEKIFFHKSSTMWH